MESNENHKSKCFPIQIYQLFFFYLYAINYLLKLQIIYLYHFYLFKYFLKIGSNTLYHLYLYQFQIYFKDF
jgi:hypothetical protein